MIKIVANNVIMSYAFNMNVVMNDEGDNIVLFIYNLCESDPTAFVDLEDDLLIHGSTSYNKNAYYDLMHD